ncbi:MAG TPA: DUF1801 domain-containing protein [Candidatus Acidoferrum sp.]|nr:DUF1801 domain-containing protein [Candidatus Acidoferrum sp.]
MSARPGKIKKDSPYIKRDNPALQKVARGLRSLVKASVPGTKTTVNSWGIPTFETDDPYCFYMIGKNHVTFGFHYGTSLHDPERLLEGTGKNIRHVKLRTPQDLTQKGLKQLVIAAAQLKGKPRMRGMSGKQK